MAASAGRQMSPWRNYGAVAQSLARRKKQVFGSTAGIPLPEPCSSRQPSPSDGARPPGSSSATAHPCLVCGRTFSYSSLLTRHLRKHTGERPFRCQICGKAFRQAFNVRVHMQSHSGYKPFKCQECDYTSVTKTYLKRHVRRVHGGLVDNPDLGAG